VQVGPDAASYFEIGPQSFGEVAVSRHAR
jgi:hypothetical protein